MGNRLRGSRRPGTTIHAHRKAIAALAAAFLLLVAGCSDDPASDSSAAQDAATSEVVAEGSPAGDPPAPHEAEFEAAVFDNPTVIDNRYFPLEPGTRHVYEGKALGDDGKIDRKVIAVVTDLVKEINGVETVAFWERDFEEGVVIETELAFFAQDNDGNVWHFGQYAESHDEDGFVGGKIWLVGLPDGAKAGIIMPADPQPGNPSYSQGFAPPPFNWTDRAKVSDVGGETCIKGSCYEDVLITEEADKENPGAFQLKYYAPDIGNIRVGFRGPDPEQEELGLVEDAVLDADGLAKARAEALVLEERGYMYSKTTPAVPRN